MDNKVKFLRGTATEYEASTKDNDTFYYTTDTKKLYLGETEITGIEIDDTSTTATDKTWSAKKINDSIPTELPANGGNADTLDGKHAVDFASVRKINTQAEVDGFLESGIYSVENVPTVFGSVNSAYYMLIVNRHRIDANYNVELAIPYIDGRQQGVYYRNCAKGTWGTWTNVADGGNAATVNGHRVNSDVPANAKFTDTTYGVATTSANGLMSSTDKSKLDGIATGANAYTHPSYTARTGVPTANVAPAFGGTFTVSQPVSDATGHITAINSRTITIPATAASASAAGLVSTGAQTLAGNKTFNGQVIPAGASAVGTAQARKIYAGTSDMTAGTTKLETGAIYLVYE